MTRNTAAGDRPAGRGVRASLALAAALTLAACAARAPYPPPLPEPRLAEVDLDADPRISAVEPIHGNDPDESAALESTEGVATYYASSLDGRPTASGVVFRNSELLAAHRTYPFGTLLRVTNLANDRSVLVRVVDRGPNGATAEARRLVIDLSQAAATRLDFMQQGLARVRVEVLSWGD
jgi:rare lipoprotein A